MKQIFISNSPKATNPNAKWLSVGLVAFSKDTSRRREIDSVKDEVNVLAMVKGEERYVFLYDDANRVETLRTLGRFAADSELSFTWYDAAVMSKKIRDMAYELEVVESDSSAKLPTSRFSFPQQEDII